MNYVSVNTPISIFEGVYIDKPESKCSRCNDRVNISSMLIIYHQPAHQVRQILMSSADMIWNGKAGTLFVFTDKAPLHTKTKLHEADVISNYDTLKPKKFIFIQRLLAGLSNRLAPSLNAILGRASSSIA